MRRAVAEARKRGGPGRKPGRPAAERLDGRHHVREIEAGTTAEGLAIALGLDDWLAMGMALAIGGQRVERDAVLEDGVELSFGGFPGTCYEIQFSSDLNHWDTIAGNLWGEVRFEDRDADRVTGESGFYRIAEQR